MLHVSKLPVRTPQGHCDTLVGSHSLDGYIGYDSTLRIPQSDIRHHYNNMMGADGRIS